MTRNHLNVCLPYEEILYPNDTKTCYNPARTGPGEERMRNLMDLMSLFTATKNPATTSIIQFKIQVYQWQYMYNSKLHNKIIWRFQVDVCWCPGTNCYNSWSDAISSQTTIFLSGCSHHKMSRLWPFGLKLPFQEQYSMRKPRKKSPIKERDNPSLIIPSLSQALACRPDATKPLPKSMNG